MIKRFCVVKKPLVCFSITLILNLLIVKQSNCQGVVSALPPSSQTVSSARMVDGVNNFSGLAPIEIPVYTIRSGKLSHPISLNYLYSGYRVEDEASWVGLGFSLTAGGVITRTVRGLPDEKTDGFFNGAPSQATVQSDPALAQKAADNQIDTHPDIFYYNFNGYSGKMIFDRSGQVHLIPQRNFKVYKNPTLTFFTIATEDGTKYTFDKLETCKVTNTTYHASLTTDFTSAWYLTSIQSVDQISGISFEYGAPVTYSKTLLRIEENREVVHNESSEYADHSSSTSGENISVFYNVQYATPVLQKISFATGYMIFNKLPRLDSSFPGLDDISVFYTNNDLYKIYSFDYEYFEVLSAGSLEGSLRKLKLRSFQERANALAITPYTFIYAPQVRKVNNSDIQSAQDHWGYYNGKVQNTRTPQHMMQFPANEWVLTEGADKNPDLLAAQTFALTKFVSPTGAITEYEYELNQADFTYPDLPVIRVGPIKVSTADPSTKSFTLLASELPNQYSAAIITINSDCGVIGDDNLCAEGAPPVFITGCPFIQLVGPNSPIIGPTSKGWNCRYQNRKYDMKLAAGNYQLKVTSNLTKNFSAELYFYKNDPAALVQNKQVGGLRILRIKTYKDSYDTNPFVRKYLYNDDAGKTTGKLNADLQYSSKVKIFDKTPTQPISACNTPKFYIWYTKFLSKISYGISPEFSVGYSRIIELQGENGENGKIENYYYSADDYSHNNELYVNSWLRGHLNKKIVYSKISTGFSKRNETIFDYDFSSYPSIKKVAITGFSVGIGSEVGPGCVVYWVPDVISKYTMFPYVINSDWYFVKKMTSIDYDDVGNPISRSTDLIYDYDNKFPVQRKQTSSNSSVKLVTLTSYPGNYTDANSFVSDLNAYNLLNIPIEEVTYSEKDLGGGLNEIKILSSKINTFKRGNNILPDYVGRVESEYSLTSPGGNPILLSNFTFSNAPTGYLPTKVNRLNFTLPSSNQYVKNLSVVDGDHDMLSGNPTKFTDRSGIVTSLVWNSSDNKIICKAVNSHMANYSSFELPANMGGWSYSGAAIIETTGNKAKTGKKYYALSSGSISSSYLDNTKKYEISFWAKGGLPTVSNTIGGNNSTGYQDNNGWKYFNRIVSGAYYFTISGGPGVLIDELYIAEDGAMVETFTYDPLKGVTSQSDPNGKLLLYEYDDLGRNLLVRDQKNAIIKRYKYGYASLALNSSINAKFYYSSGSGSGVINPGEVITFSSLNIDAGIQYDWSFGDGTVLTNSTSEVTHSFSATGSFTALLTVRRNGESNFTSQTINIVAPYVTDPNWEAPTLDINITRNFANQTVRIDAQATPSPGGTPPINKYEWLINTSPDPGVGIWHTTLLAPPDFVIPGYTVTINTSAVFATYYVHCRARDSANVYSKEAIKAAP